MASILVAPYDDKPVPKVIDFGLAKAMHPSLTERTLRTAHETVPGTPIYMSPEQAQLNNLDVDTWSDIYSLGVLLYELLTGTTPLERKRYKEAAWDEVRGSSAARRSGSPGPALVIGVEKGSANSL
jgi:eukaryotic-like serine/threonine-protein kinase